MKNWIWQEQDPLMILASEPRIWGSCRALRPLGVRQKDASTWARTRDLSVNSRALCQLSHGGMCMELVCSKDLKQATKLHKKVLPGFEPGSLDSKSRVITITLQKLLDTQKVVIVGLEPTTLGLLDPCSTI